MLIVAALLLATLTAPRAQAQKPLDIYFIDVEGGQATLFVTPSGESMLIDTGYPGLGDRDVNRVLGTIKDAGLTRLDYLARHALPQRSRRQRGDDRREDPRRHLRRSRAVGRDGRGRHGDLRHLRQGTRARQAHARETGRQGADPGPRRHVSSPPAASGSRARCPGPAQANPLCAAFKPRDADPSENARSVGSLIAFGRFRLIDLGDLTWNKEQELVCPNNLLGTVDVYLTTHHGLAQSDAPVIVHAR